MAAGTYLGLVVHPIVMGVCVVTFWRAAEMEDVGWLLQKLVWSALSGGAFLATWVFLGFGWVGIIGGQILLGIGIAGVRAAILMRKTGE